MTALIGAALVRGDKEFWSAARSHVEAASCLSEQVVAAVAFSRSREPRGLILELQEAEPEAFAAVVGSGLRQILPGMASFWHPFLEEAKQRGEVRAELDIPRAAEWVLRMVLSLVTIPGEVVNIENAADLSAFLSEFLVSGLR